MNISCNEIIDEYFFILSIIIHTRHGDRIERISPIQYRKVIVVLMHAPLKIEDAIEGGCSCCYLSFAYQWIHFQENLFGINTTSSIYRSKIIKCQK